MTIRHFGVSCVHISRSFITPAGLEPFLQPQKKEKKNRQPQLAQRTTYSREDCFYFPKTFTSKWVNVPLKLLSEFH